MKSFVRSLFRIKIVATPRKMHKRIGIFPAASSGTQFGGLGAILLSRNQKAERLRVRNIGFFGGVIVLGFGKVSSEGSIREVQRTGLLIAERGTIRLKGSRCFVTSLVKVRMISSRKRRLKAVSSMLRANTGSICIIDGSNTGSLLVPTVRTYVRGISITTKRVRMRLLPKLHWARNKR